MEFRQQKGGVAVTAFQKQLVLEAVMMLDMSQFNSRFASRGELMILLFLVILAATTYGFYELFKFLIL